MKINFWTYYYNTTADIPVILRGHKKMEGRYNTFSGNKEGEWIEWKTLSSDINCDRFDVTRYHGNFNSMTGNLDGPFCGFAFDTYMLSCIGNYVDGKLHGEYVTFKQFFDKCHHRNQVNINSILYESDVKKEEKNTLLSIIDFIEEIYKIYKDPHHYVWNIIYNKVSELILQCKTNIVDLYTNSDLRNYDLKKWIFIQCTMVLNGRYDDNTKKLLNDLYGTFGSVTRFSDLFTNNKIIKESGYTGKLIQNYHWQNRYEILHEYLHVHHTYPNTSFSHSLNLWCRRQVIAYFNNKLTPEQKRLFDNLVPSFKKYYQYKIQKIFPSQEEDLEVPHKDSPEVPHKDSPEVPRKDSSEVPRKDSSEVPRKDSPEVPRKDSPENSHEISPVLPEEIHISPIIMSCNSSPILINENSDDLVIVTNDESDDEDWKTKFTELKKYITENKKYPDINPKETLYLFEWICNQIFSYKLQSGITFEQIKLLSQLPAWEWDIHHLTQVKLT
jgi:hypothetical protein